MYVPLDSVLTFNAGHMQQGHLDIERTFNFKNGSWVYSSYGALEQPLSSAESYQQKDNLSYAIFFTTSGDTVSGGGKVWEFKTNGRCRAVAEYWLQITSFAVDDDWVFIVGRYTWNASSVWKFSLTDGTESRLGQADYTMVII